MKLSPQKTKSNVSDLTHHHKHLNTWISLTFLRPQISFKCDDDLAVPSINCEIFFSFHFAHFWKTHTSMTFTTVDRHCIYFLLQKFILLSNFYLWKTHFFSFLLISLAVSWYMHYFLLLQTLKINIRNLRMKKNKDW